MAKSAMRQTATVQVHDHGKVPAADMAYAARKIGALTRLISLPVLSVRVRLTQSHDPALQRPARAQANLDLNGRLLRAHVAAPTMTQAIDALEDRLRDQLDRLLPDWESRRGSLPVNAPGEWRHSSIPTQRSPYYPRPQEERQVVRHKSFSLPHMTPDEAAFDMDMLDYDFHLFTDADTGLDSVLSRAAVGTFELAQLRPSRGMRPLSALPLTYNPQPAPRLTVSEATERLQLSGLPFVFFENSSTGRGNVLYHRYDGNYGLITPAV